MTRETRIGLLVGLGFIIMFGLVLSELAGTSATAPAPETVVEDTSRYTWTPLIEEVLPLADQGEQLAEATDGSAETGQAHISLAAQRPGSEEILQSAMAQPADSTKQVAQEPPARQTVPARIYKVQPNDSLIKIARKVYGRDHGRQYRRIFEANRDKLQDARMVIVGQELVIPPLASASTVTAPAEQPSGASAQRRAPQRHYREMDIAQLRDHFGVAARPRSGRRIYVVQRGDNLTKIARKVLNDDSPRAVLEIYNANKDKLPSPDQLPIGAKLNIPAAS
ncbi:MAG: LysM peptidoglycan-binding domain-containing protein [Planctomycetota bacterium]|nr:LysM peptidoglycan-binding domain-containing protein [Planctomycetota bacterium]